MKTQQLEIVAAGIKPPEVHARTPTAGEMMSGAMQLIQSGQLTGEKVEAADRMLQVCERMIDREHKAAFAKAFFMLRKEISGLELYADKTIKTTKGDTICAYCSEQELSEKLEPLLMRHGFAMMFGQRQEEGRAVAVVTLMHEAGHQETREYSVRSGATNAMKDATAADAGATTTAWRHLVIKLFGLKSRIKAEDDPRNLGEHITSEQAQELSDRVRAAASDERAFLKYAGVKLGDGEEVKPDHYRAIMTSRFADLDASLKRKERTK